MQYRKFPKIDFNASVLGFGAMRLPTHKDSGDIDEQKAMEMIYYAIDNGVNYIDTAYPYHNKMSENLLGRILKNGYRKKVKIATKLPPWDIKQESDIDRIFEEQCKKLNTDRIDFYLLHALNKENWEKLIKFNILDWFENKIAQGAIGYPGFSFHGEYQVFEKIIDAYDWTLCQIQYNYMDIETQAGTKGLAYAASKKIAVIVMEPLLGGKLVKAPRAIKEIWESADKKRTPTEWALHWLWNQSEVTMVLSGMSTLQHVKDNLEYAETAQPNILNTEELTLIEKVREQYKKFSPIPCTGCNYCMPCPQGVNIPWNFSLYNDGVMYESPAAVRASIQFMPEDNRPHNCTSCGICEEKCPQQIEISEWIRRVDNVLEKGEPFPELTEG